MNNDTKIILRFIAFCAKIIITGIPNISWPQEKILTDSIDDKLINMIHEINTNKSNNVNNELNKN